MCLGRAGGQAETAKRHCHLDCCLPSFSRRCCKWAVSGKWALFVEIQTHYWICNRTKMRLVLEWFGFCSEESSGGTNSNVGAFVLTDTLVCAWWELNSSVRHQRSAQHQLVQQMGRTCSDKNCLFTAFLWRWLYQNWIRKLPRPTTSLIIFQLFWFYIRWNLNQEKFTRLGNHFRTCWMFKTRDGNSKTRRGKNKATSRR